MPTWLRDDRRDLAMGNHSGLAFYPMDIPNEGRGDAVMRSQKSGTLPRIRFAAERAPAHPSRKRLNHLASDGDAGFPPELALRPQASEPPAPGIRPY